MKIKRKDVVITPELYEEILKESGHLYDFLEYDVFVYITKRSMFLNKIDLKIHVMSHDRISLIRSVINVLYRIQDMVEYKSFKSYIEELGFPDYYKMKDFYSKK